MLDPNTQRSRGYGFVRFALEVSKPGIGAHDCIYSLQYALWTLAVQNEAKCDIVHLDRQLEMQHLPHTQSLSTTTCAHDLQLQQS